MKKRTILIALLLLLFCLTSCKAETEFEQFEVTMHCVKIDSNGDILRDLTVTFVAEEVEPDRYDINILFSDTDDPPFDAESGTFNGYDKNPDRYDCFGIGYSVALKGFTGVKFTIDRDRTMFQMFVEARNDTEEIYVGSIDPDFDPAEILEYFSVVHQDK